MEYIPKDFKKEYFFFENFMNELPKRVEAP